MNLEVLEFLPYILVNIILAFALNCFKIFLILYGYWTQSTISWWAVHPCCSVYVSNNMLTQCCYNVLSLSRLGPEATCQQEIDISNPGLWACCWRKEDHRIPEPDLQACWGAFSHHGRSSSSSSLPAETWNKFPSPVFLCGGPWGSMVSRIPQANRCKDLKIEDVLSTRKICIINLKHLSCWVHVWRCWQSAQWWQIQPRVFYST